MRTEGNEENEGVACIFVSFVGFSGSFHGRHGFLFVCLASFAVTFNAQRDSGRSLRVSRFLPESFEAMNRRLPNHALQPGESVAVALYNDTFNHLQLSLIKGCNAWPNPIY